MVKRRQFIALIGGAALFPSVARAQQRTRVIGVLTANVETDPDAQARVRAFSESLAARWDAADDEVQDDLRFEIRWPGPDASLQRRYAEELASLSADLGQQLRVAVVAISVRRPGEIATAMAEFAGSGGAGLIILPDGGFIADNRNAVIETAARHKLPAIYGSRFYVANGGLMSYGADLTGQFRDGAECRHGRSSWSGRSALPDGRRRTDRLMRVEGERERPPALCHRSLSALIKIKRCLGGCASSCSISTGLRPTMHRRQVLKMFAGFALCPLCARVAFAAEHHWSYEGEAGPDKWGGLDPADAACSVGHQQSPIDISGAIGARQPPLEINWSKRPETIVNNGHTIQLNCSDGDAIDLGGRSYVLRQFHFHHPSEHRIDGKSFAMEAHFVHASADGLAVVGVLMVPGRANAVFNKIVSTMPAEEGRPVPADRSIDPNRLLPRQRAYYHYEGSLTTPPCSETVDWLVLAHPIDVDEADIGRFAKLYPMNARPLQGRDRRFILSSAPKR